ncbi:MAG: glycosyltransferase family 2 protein [Bacteroidetes bacterium]|nr:glycosyltransferase family 2 protein [Bacteroidota bacterium]
MFGFKSKKVKFSFVILTWNRYKFLDLCLNSLTKSISSPDLCEILVLDNGSTDKTEETALKYSSVTYKKLKKNFGLNSYKQLFRMSKGEYIVIVDDDVIEFPENIDTIFEKYMSNFSDFGYLALNVIQNEFTNGAKPGPEMYTLVSRNDLVIEEGPTGGWCSCMRKSEYKKIRWKFIFTDLSMKKGEYGALTRQLKKRLGLRNGIIRDHTCFHASGQHYTKLFGHLDREIEKYAMVGMTRFVEIYQQEKNKDSEKVDNP